MATTPKIEQLEDDDSDLKAAIDALCKKKKLTLDQLHERVGKMGLDVSRATIGRYRKNVREVGKLMLENRDNARMMKDVMGGLGDDEQSRLNYEMLQGANFRLLMQITRAAEENDGELTVSVKDLKMMTEAHLRLAQAKKHDEQRVREQNKAAKEEATQKTLDEVDAELKKVGQPGFTKERIDAIKTRVLGV